MLPVALHEPSDTIVSGDVVTMLMRSWSSVVVERGGWYIGRYSFCSPEIIERACACVILVSGDMMSWHGESDMIQSMLLNMEMNAPAPAMNGSGVHTLSCMSCLVHTREYLSHVLV